MRIVHALSLACFTAFKLNWAIRANYHSTAMTKHVYQQALKAVRHDNTQSSLTKPSQISKTESSQILKTSDNFARLQKTILMYEFASHMKTS